MKQESQDRIVKDLCYLCAKVIFSQKSFTKLLNCRVDHPLPFTTVSQSSKQSTLTFSSGDPICTKTRNACDHREHSTRYLNSTSIHAGYLQHAMHASYLHCGTVERDSWRMTAGVLGAWTQGIPTRPWL